MRSWKTISAGLCLTPLLASSAAAATISTAAVPVPFIEGVTCTLVNVGDRTIPVRSLEVIGHLGDTFAETASSGLAPRRTLQVFVGGREHSFIDGEGMFCQADVQGAAKNFRLTICVRPDFGACRFVSE